MDSGYRFENAGMVITCISFHSIGNRNVGLFQRESDGMYITARNTSKDKDGTYSWAWGNYFTGYTEALLDYYNRKSEMQRYTD